MAGGASWAVFARAMISANDPFFGALTPSAGVLVARAGAGGADAGVVFAARWGRDGVEEAGGAFGAFFA